MVQGIVERSLAIQKHYVEEDVRHVVPVTSPALHVCLAGTQTAEEVCLARSIVWSEQRALSAGFESAESDYCKPVRID